ncbi:hypothetical protein R5W23_000115 [Gemmata sp. JC673]|uniref:Type II toxin-antitoxin system VapC family toxin n=1 Tax=Gemmata algarum TaxID=2975278 RepID=A0ABU5ERH8_9BACT|nr:hypothetical protein [Gemmata algarum]MDY3557588.1 hypothetical protein [Gemmata algarum]
MAFRLIDTNVVSDVLDGHTLAAAYLPYLAGYGTVDEVRERLRDRRAALNRLNGLLR